MIRRRFFVRFMFACSNLVDAYSFNKIPFDSEIYFEGLPVQVEAPCSNEQRLKELIEQERIAKKLWEQRWAWYADRNLVEDILREESLVLGLEPEFYFKRVKRKKSEKEYVPLFDIKPSPAVPTISSKFVGWRSERGYSLENFGPLYISPRFTMYPKGKDPPKTYETIVLG